MHLQAFCPEDESRVVVVVAWPQAWLWLGSCCRSLSMRMPKKSPSAPPSFVLGGLSMQYHSLRRIGSGNNPPHSDKKTKERPFSLLQDDAAGAEDASGGVGDLFHLPHRQLPLAAVIPDDDDDVGEENIDANEDVAAENPEAQDDVENQDLAGALFKPGRRARQANVT